ncbi:hypothetical protein [Colwellia sp. 20A7]|uniref:hypothetical protein n=1 Tax=Colwellia sp. 20A7 TaxID=2689569 RepID=UPI0013578E6A|nr:hypothetical protein [Colwellia sp. 20A7]
MTVLFRHSELDSESQALCFVVHGFAILRTIQPHAWDSVLSDQRNDRNGDLWNDGFFRHPELDSGSQALCYIF